MRIAIVTESFLPSVNGVTTSVCRVVEELVEAGHEAMIIAPAPAPAEYAGTPVHTMPSLPVRSFQMGLPTRQIASLLAEFRPDLVHVASPFLLGARGLTAARDLGIPTVAVYQTDLARYCSRYGGSAGDVAARVTWRHLRRVHALADLTLAPSTAALADLDRAGIDRIDLWRRGVQTRLFNASWREDAGSRALRRCLAPDQETIVGYVGRLAAEKEVERLAPLLDLPGDRVVVVGDGPSRASLQGQLPGAQFLGHREGDDLARAYAALDVFVHTGTSETFGQTIQEASATGLLPVVAPARGGPLDLVAHGRTGPLFDPDDPNALRAAVADLTVADDAWERRAVLGEASAAAMASRSGASLTAELLGHYEAVARRASHSLPS